ncbi:MAG TPA: hypothetical protein VMZ04_02770 [Anaerolineae bacterium]|nr:hypothetical protein [Anaerolineae bacterium]
MIEGLIVGHRDIGEGIIRALESISGNIKHLSFISNNGLSTNELSGKIREHSINNRHEGLFVFVDVYGGSCWQAAKMAKLHKIHILSGVNLPMLLSFINKRETYPFHELADILETDGKRGIINE